VNRSDFQKLAQERLADARVLLAAKRWSAAYYLVGYAVESGLKACVLVRLGTEAEIVFEDKRYSEKCWTHNLTQLVDLAGLKTTLDTDGAADPDLQRNWELVRDWSEASRYTGSTKTEAEELYDAIADKKHGVLSWIKVRW
jgi:HEPN domain-containing protein